MTTDFDAEANRRFRSEWPGVLGAMHILSSLRGAACGGAPGAGSKARVFTQVPANLFASAEHLHVEGIAERLVKLWRLDGRFDGNLPSDRDTIGSEYRIACYSLVYLSRSLRVAELLLQVFVPLLRDGLFAESLRYRIVRTFRDAVWDLLFDVQGLDNDDDFDPSDWPALWNGYDDESLAPLLAIAALAPFEHPWFPNQEVWLAHNRDHLGATHLGWVDEEAFKAWLRSLYTERGLDTTDYLVMRDPDR